MISKAHTPCFLSAILAVGLLAMGGCEGGRKAEEKEKKAEVSPPLKKEDPYAFLAPTIVESLVVAKARYRITKDEYWKDKGGVLANESFEVWYPYGRMAVTHAFFLFRRVVGAQKKLADSLGVVPKRKLVIVCSKDLNEYSYTTGQDWWQYADVGKDTVVYQPVHILYARHIADIAIPHEYYQWAVRVLSGGKAPRWMEEGIASYLSGEERILFGQLKEFARERELKMEPGKVEEVLIRDNIREDSRIAYYNAFRMVGNLISRYGVARLSDFLSALEGGAALDEASRRAFGKSYREILASVADFKIEL